jgi:hypothetical protein
MAEEKKEKKEESKTNGNGIKRIPARSLFKDLISGSTVTDKIILKNLGYIMMLTLLGTLYIANRFHAEKLTREAARLSREVRDLRSESLSTSADLMEASKQSEVLKLIRDHNLELEELREPPYKVIINK